MGMLFGPRRALLGGAVAATYADKVLGYGPIVYWPLWEAAGATAADLVDSPAQDGTYTGATLGQPGIGDGNTCPLFDGVNDDVDVFSAPLDAAFDGDEGSLAIWCKVFNAAVWSDGTNRFATSFGEDDNNRLFIAIRNFSNTILDVHRVAATASEFVRPILGPSVAWIHVCYTWSMIADQLIVYIDGAQTGGIQAGLLAYVGSLVANRATLSGGLGVAYWYGWLAHCAIWDSPLAPGIVADLAVVI